MIGLGFEYFAIPESRYWVCISLKLLRSSNMLQSSNIS